MADLAYGHPSFSQFGEDRVLESVFAGQRTGFCVDVGAYAPQHMSNTYLLYRRGWRGINIEPDPVARREIERVRRRDVTLPYAVSEIAGEVEFVLDGSTCWTSIARVTTSPSCAAMTGLGIVPAWFWRSGTTARTSRTWLNRHRGVGLVER